MAWCDERAMPTALTMTNACFLHVFCSSGLCSHATVRNSQKAVAVYEEMLSKSIEPNQKTLSHVIVAHSRGDHDAMYRSATGVLCEIHPPR